MSEKFDVATTYDQYTPIEKALEETTVLATGKEAMRRAVIVNAEDGEVLHTNEAYDDNTRELDMVVKYLMGSSTKLTGMVQITQEGDESEYQFVDEAEADFQGFVISRRGGALHYDYLFNCIIDENKRVLTNEEIIERTGEEDASLQKVRVQAPVDKVFMRFHEMHSIRAAAILETSYPEVLRELDIWLLGFQECTEEEKILMSGKFEMPTIAFEAEEDRKLFHQAVRIYINQLIDIDTEVAYRVSVSDEYLDVSLGINNLERKRLEGQRLFTASYVDVYTSTYDEESPNDEGHPLGTFMEIGIYGILHAEDPLHKGTYSMLPTCNITEFVPLRERPDFYAEDKA